MKIKWIPLIKWIVIIILSILLFLECRKHINIPDSSKPQPDTVRVHDRDTIFPKDTIWSFRDRPVPKYIHDTVEKPVAIDCEECKRMKLYLDTTSDKNITLFDSLWIQGLLRKRRTSYKLKVPLIITDSVTTTIKVPTLYPPNYELHVGTLIGYDLLAPTVDLSIKRHTMTVGYNIQTKQPILGYKFTIFRK